MQKGIVGGGGEVEIMEGLGEAGNRGASYVIESHSKLYVTKVLVQSN